MSDAGLTQAGQGRLFAKILRVVRTRVRFGLGKASAINPSDLSDMQRRDIGLLEGRPTSAQMRCALIDGQSSLLRHVGQHR